MAGFLRDQKGHGYVPHRHHQGHSSWGGERGLLGKRRRLRAVELTETFDDVAGDNGSVRPAKRPRKATNNPYLRAMSKQTRPQYGGPSTNGLLPSAESASEYPCSSSTYCREDTEPIERSLSASTSQSSTYSTSRRKKNKKKKKKWDMKEELMRLKEYFSQKETPVPRSPSPVLLSAGDSPSPLPGCSKGMRTVTRLEEAPSSDDSPSPLPDCSTGTRTVSWLAEEVDVASSSDDSPSPLPGCSKGMRTVSWLAEEVDVASSSPHGPRRKQKSATCMSSQKSRHPPPQQVVALDCEMVGCLPDDSGLEEQSGSTPVSFSERLHLLATKKLGKRKRGLKEVSVAGRCTIVDYNGDILYDSFIRPNRRIISLRTFVSGITQKDMASATPIDNAREEILKILQGKLVVAHDIKHDLASLGISLPPTSIWDTSSSKELRQLAGLPVSHMPSLRKLAQGVLGVEIQSGRHSSLEDAQVAMQLYRAVEKE